MPRPPKMECECGNPKGAKDEACGRCAQLDAERLGAQARRDGKNDIIAFIRNRPAPATYADLAEDAGVSLRQVVRIMRELENAGLVMRTQSAERPAHGGSRKVVFSWIEQDENATA